MACVDSRGHGGDCDPPEDPNWRPPVPADCQTEIRTNKRGVTTNRQLREMYEKNGYRPFPIQFDVDDQKTARPVGPMAKHFSSLLGTLVEGVPKWYSSWDAVPAENKAVIWPEIATYFDMERHLRGRDHELIRAGINASLAERYRDRKYLFKKVWFTKRGGEGHPREIRRFPPPNMEPVDWGQLVDFYTNAKQVSRSASNSANREQLKYTSGHGSKSYAQRRYEQFTTTGQYGSLIDNFRDMHHINGEWVNDTAREQHAHMLRLVSEQVGSSCPKTEEQIVEEALGSRRGHNRGRGRKLESGSSSGASSSQPSVGSRQTHTVSAEEYRQMCQWMQSQQQKSTDWMSQLASLLSQQGVSGIPPMPTFSPMRFQQQQDDEDDEEDDEVNLQDEDDDDDADE